MSRTKLHFKFRHGKWHCWRRYRGTTTAMQWAYVGSGSTIDAAHVHLLLQERCAPPHKVKPD